MLKKIKKMFGSLRFWTTVLIGVAYCLDSLEILPGAYAKAIELFGSLGVTIRTIDKFR